MRSECFTLNNNLSFTLFTPGWMRNTSQHWIMRGSACSLQSLRLLIPAILSDFSPIPRTILPFRWCVACVAYAVFNTKWQNMESRSCFISTASDKHGACLTWRFFTRSQQSNTYRGVSNLNVLLQTSSTINFSCHYICFSLQFFISMMVWVPAHLWRNGKMSFWL